MQAISTETVQNMKVCGAKHLWSKALHDRAWCHSGNSVGIVPSKAPFLLQCPCLQNYFLCTLYGFQQHPFHLTHAWTPSDQRLWTLWHLKRECTMGVWCKRTLEEGRGTEIPCFFSSRHVGQFSALHRISSVLRWCNYPPAACGTLFATVFVFLRVSNTEECSCSLLPNEGKNCWQWRSLLGSIFSNLLHTMSERHRYRPSRDLCCLFGFIWSFRNLTLWMRRQKLTVASVCQRRGRSSDENP